MITPASALMCMTMALYFEARDQPSVGQLAVGQVVINRVHNAFGVDPCDVITKGPLNYRGQYVRNACQFSFMCDGKREDFTNSQAFFGALVLSGLTLLGAIPDITFGADHYHTRDVRPSWSTQFIHTVTYTDHKFLRSK